MEVAGWKLGRLVPFFFVSRRTGLVFISCGAGEVGGSWLGAGGGSSRGIFFAGGIVGDGCVGGRW